MKIYTKKGDEGETFIGRGYFHKFDLQIETVGAIDEALADICLAAETIKEEKNGIAGVLETVESKIKRLESMEHQLIGHVSDLESAVHVLDGESIATMLFKIGAALHNGPKKDGITVIKFADSYKTAKLEEAIDNYTEELPPLKNFIIPSGGPSAQLFRARASVRRAERKMVELQNKGRQAYCYEQKHGWKWLIYYLVSSLREFGVPLPVVSVNEAVLHKQEFDLWNEIRYLNRLSDFLFTAARYTMHVLGKKETIWKP